MNRLNYKLFIGIWFVALLLSCNKPLQWDLDEIEKWDVCQRYDCSSFDGITYGDYGPSQTVTWNIGSAYNGNGFLCGASSGGYIQFDVNVDRDFALKLWIKSSSNQAENANLPLVRIQNGGSTITMENLFEDAVGRWTPIQSTDLIPAGGYTIRVDFEQAPCCLDYGIDEIQVLCAK